MMQDIEINKAELNAVRIAIWNALRGKPLPIVMAVLSETTAGLVAAAMKNPSMSLKRVKDDLDMFSRIFKATPDHNPIKRMMDVDAKLNAAEPSKH